MKIPFYLLYYFLCLMPYTALAFDNNEFRVFDATSYYEKPDMKFFGIEALRVVGAGELWKHGVSRELPELESVRASAVKVQPLNKLIALDVEHWTLHSNIQRTDSSLKKLLTILRKYKQLRPDLLVGYYSFPPLWNKYRAVLDDKHPDKIQWIEDNKRLDGLANEVDVIFPSLYTTDEDPEKWKKFAIEYLKQAKKMANGKPVYAFVWPQYHEGLSEKKYQFLPATYWRVQLETIYKHADGVIIWGGWGGDGRVKWNEAAPWWDETKSFLTHIKNNK